MLLVEEKQADTVTKTTRPSQPLRLAIVNEFFYPDNAGGTGTVLTELAESLRRLHPEIQISVVTSRNGYRTGTEDYSAEEEWNGVHITRVSTPSAKNKGVVARLAINADFARKALAALTKQNQKAKFDAVLVGTAPPTLAGCAHLFRMLSGVPYIYIVYDLDPDRAVTLGVLRDKSVPARILYALQKSWLQAAGQVVVLGRCMQERIGQTYNVASDRISVIPIGADPDSIAALPRDDEYRAKLGFKSENFVLCYSGNFGRYHNFDTLLDAAGRLKNEQPNVRFLLVGDGAQREKIANRVQNESLTNVTLRGFVPKAEYSQLLAAADASLLTLEPGMEGLCVPSKFYSILASGRPVLALLPAVSEVGRVVNEERCGICVSPGDEKAILDAVSYLQEHQDEAREMGNRSRQALCERFSTTHIANHYKDVIHKVALRTNRS